MPGPDDFLRLLDADAPREAYDAVLARLDAAAPAEADEHAAAHARALRLREALALHRGREAELAALYETANDLTGLRDVEAVLTAIVRRARQLLRADMTYLSLNDEAEGASYMRVTDGALTPEFGRLRLPLGTGLLGLVAQSGAPYFTADYQSDERFLHRGFVDEAVEREQIRAILGVPLMVDGEVIGALLAVHRRVRRFPPGEVALLTSFAAHAAVALQNARLFDAARAAVADAAEATARLRERTESVERAALARDRLTDALLRGAGLDEIAAAVGEAVGGTVSVHDEDDAALVGPPAPVALTEPRREATRTGRSVEPEDGVLVAVARAGTEHLATLVVVTEGRRSLDRAERRTLERGALVVALVLLFARTEAEAEERARGDLLVDLLAGTGDPARLRERARRQGLALDAPVSVAVGRADDPPGDGRRAARFAAGRGGLAALHDGAVVVVEPDADPLDLGTEVRRALGRGPVGVARGPLGEAHREARRCRDTLHALGRDDEVADLDRLGLARLLLGTSAPSDLDGFVAATLGPVLEYDASHGTALLLTMEAWFDAGGALRATAERLHVHPNTVSQRLDRVERVLGRGWRSGRWALEVQLALQVHHLRRV